MCCKTKVPMIYGSLFSFYSNLANFKKGIVNLTSPLSKYNISKLHYYPLN